MKKMKRSKKSKSAVNGAIQKMILCYLKQKSVKGYDENEIYAKISKDLKLSIYKIKKNVEALIKKRLVCKKYFTQYFPATKSTKTGLILYVENKKKKHKAPSYWARYWGPHFKTNSMYEKIKEELNKKSKEELLAIFKKEVLDYNEYKYLSIDERKRLMMYMIKYEALKLAKFAAKIEGDLDAVKQISKAIRKLREENEYLLTKKDRAEWMEEVCYIWRMKTNAFPIQGISNEELIDAITKMRILRRVSPPFNYKRYMKKVFKGRQKGRAYKTFYEH